MFSELTVCLSLGSDRPSHSSDRLSKRCIPDATRRGAIAKEQGRLERYAPRCCNCIATLVMYVYGCNPLIEI